MSLLLCRDENIRHPLYIEKLGIHIYSSQELCYVIYNHPLLAMDRFVDVSLLEFLRADLGMGQLAARLEKSVRVGASHEELLVPILQEGCYYTPSEINKYKQKLAGYKKMHRAEFLKVTADYFYTLKQYGKAVEEYEKILALPRDQVVDDSFVSRIWNNIGASYAKVFWFEKAMRAFDMAYSYGKSQELMKRIYQLTLLDPKLTLKERYESIITEEMKKQWAQEFENARKKAYETDEVQGVVLLFQKDPVKRSAGAGELLAKWKQEYRNMI